MHFLRGQDGKPALNGNDGLEVTEDSNIGHADRRWWSERSRAHVAFVFSLFLRRAVINFAFLFSLLFFLFFFEMDAIPMLHILVYM